MATVKIVRPNNTEEQNQKVLKNLARTMEKIVFEQYRKKVKVELSYSSNSRQA